MFSTSHGAQLQGEPAELGCTSRQARCLLANTFTTHSNGTVQDAASCRHGQLGPDMRVPGQRFGQEAVEAGSSCYAGL